MRPIVLLATKDASRVLYAREKRTPFAGSGRMTINMIVERPFGQIKPRVLADGRLLLRGLQGGRTEIALAVLARNLRRVINIVGPQILIARLGSL